MKNVFYFLKDLKQNNNKEWFDQNRDKYLKTKEDFLEFTQILINSILDYDKSIKDLNAKDCLFRIFRDVRFSKDKTPYKTNYGSFIAEGGRKSVFPGYYFHLEPGNSFVGGGVYCPQKQELDFIRKSIHNNPQEFINLINDNNFKNYYPELYTADKLKMAPKGYDKNFEYIDLLKYKSYTVTKHISDEIILNGKLLAELEKGFKLLYNFNKYLRKAIIK